MHLIYYRNPNPDQHQAFCTCGWISEVYPTFPMMAAAGHGHHQSVHRPAAPGYERFHQIHDNRRIEGRQRAIQTLDDVGLNRRMATAAVDALLDAGFSLTKFRTMAEQRQIYDESRRR